MFRDEWESEDELWQFFDTVSDAEELHLFADGFNWDTGVGEVRRVIRHPLCDKATALLIYWRGAPGYYARYLNPAEITNPDYVDHFDLLREIEQKVIAGHYHTHRFRYDPKSDKGHDMTTQYSSYKQKRSIPVEMYV